MVMVIANLRILLSSNVYFFFSLFYIDLKILSITYLTQQIKSILLTNEEWTFK